MNGPELVFLFAAAAVDDRDVQQKNCTTATNSSNSSSANK